MTVLGEGKSVLFRKVSLIQGVLFREVSIIQGCPL